MKKLVGVFSLAVLVAASLKAQPAPATPAAVAPDAVVISTDGFAITRAEFEDAIKALPAEYQEQANNAGRRSFATDFLRMKVLAAAGEKAGVEKDPAFARELAMARVNLLAQAILKRIETETTVSDEELHKAYVANKGEYEKVKARHILVAFKGSPAASPDKPALSEEAAEAKAQELRARIVQGKAKFEDVAKSESDDTGTGANGGDLGEFGRGQMVPEFEKAAFAAEAGKVAPVVRSEFGYHVLRVDERVTTSFEEAKPTLEAKARVAKIQEEIGKLVDGAKPVYNPDYFGK